MSDTIITHETFNIDNLFFEKPKQCTMKSSIKFSRIYPKYRYPNGQVDKVYIQTPELFSWGIQENKKRITYQIIRFRLLCMTETRR